MLLYSLLDRILPRSYLAKVVLVAVIFGQVPLVALLALQAFAPSSPAHGWLAIAGGSVLALAGLFLAVRAILQPMLRVEAAFAAYEDSGIAPQPLPDGHEDTAGRLMRRMNSLMRTTETRIDAAQRLAESDPLTGLLNRRGLERRLAARHGSGAGGALLMVDADHFKRINDEFGHDTGDRVLRDLARLLHRELRHQDLAARFGGEEFVIYLSGLGRARALQVAERLRMAVEDGVCVAGAPQTVSIGVAVWEAGEPLPAVLKRADDAVYAAKASGRNRVVLADPDLPAAPYQPAPCTGPGPTRIQAEP